MIYEFIDNLNISTFFKNNSVIKVVREKKNVWHPDFSSGSDPGVGSGITSPRSETLMKLD